jgi:hypothetical protein
MPERNELGFTEKQLRILLNYCKATRKDPRISYQKIHRSFSPYSRRKSTVDLIKKGYEKEVITGPVLYANIGIEVTFMDNVGDPMKLLQEYEKDNETTLAYALDGQWSFIHFKRGASTLQYANSTIPLSYPDSNYHIEDISFDEKGQLPVDLYPHRWLEEHWEIYKIMASPRNVTLREVSKKTGLAWETVKKYYYEIVNQSRVLTCFFPLGKEGYSHQVVTFRTDYEIGLLKSLRKLDRTTFVYKINGIIMLVLCLIPRPRDFNISTDKFRNLEENGYIHDLHICTPRGWIQNY